MNFKLFFLESEDKLLSPEETASLVSTIRAGDGRSKNKGSVSPESVRKPHILTRVQLSQIPTEVVDFLKQTTDPKRVAAYTSQKIDTPVFLTRRRNAEGYGVSDGGHRVLAAIARGDKDIPAIIPAENQPLRTEL